MQPLHTGLVIIIPNTNRVIQRQLFRGALDVLSTVGKSVNPSLLYIEDDDVTFDLYDQSARS